MLHDEGKEQEKQDNGDKDLDDEPSVGADAGVVLEQFPLRPHDVHLDIIGVLVDS